MRFGSELAWGLVGRLGADTAPGPAWRSLLSPPHGPWALPWCLSELDVMLLRSVPHLEPSLQGLWWAGGRRVQLPCLVPAEQGHVGDSSGQTHTSEGGDAVPMRR